ncbi:MAG TPA: GNAT family N-acetyltransferase, partial [Terriglobales bacterium]|nr:GNAT family N-acetyltransferase [Terriglobales bacterium]
AARNFQIGLATRLAPRKQMRLFILTVGGVPAAWGLVLVWRDDWLWYMPTFNLDYEKFSPGVVLLDLVLLQAMSEGVKVLDLGIGDETYKQRFANGKTEVARVVLTRSIPRYLRLRLRVAAASLLARSPALDRLARAQLRKPRAKKPGTKTPQ